MPARVKFFAISVPSARSEMRRTWALRMRSWACAPQSLICLSYRAISSALSPDAVTVVSSTAPLVAGGLVSTRPLGVKSPVGCACSVMLAGLEITFFEE